MGICKRGSIFDESNSFLSLNFKKILFISAENLNKHRNYSRMIFKQENLCFLTILLLALQTFHNVKASQVSESQVASDLTHASNVLVTTSAPVPSTHSTHNPTSTSSPDLHRTIKSDLTVSVKNETQTAPVPHNLSSVASKIIHHSSVVESPKVTIVDTKTKISTGTTSLPVVKQPTHSLANKSISKFHDYLKPICDVVDKIQLNQLSKIQTQFKQLVHLSTGKLATCFMDSYKFDPTSSQITGHNLKAICLSNKSTAELPNLFETCAKHNWSPLIDEELDKIVAARANHTKNHQHSNNDSLAVLEHGEDEDEVSFISGVVNKFFGPEKDAVNTNSDVNVLDIAVTTPRPPHSILTTSLAPSLMNDPNTFVVFVDSTSTTALPKLTTVVQTSHKPSSTNEGDLPRVRSSSTSSPGTTATKSPIESLGIAMSTSQPLKSTNPSSTSMPNETITHNNVTIPSTSAPSSTKIQSTVKVANTKIDISPSLSSKGPLENILTTKRPDAIKKITKSVADKIGSTIKPSMLLSTIKPGLKTIDTFEEILKRQEKEKQELEQRLKSEREKFMKQLQKKQDEIDAQNAVKALQHQRDASSGHSDAKLHQIEHERQMSMDPIGHTLKHQQYELNKQQKMFAGK